MTEVRIDSSGRGGSDSFRIQCPYCDEFVYVPRVVGEHDFRCTKNRNDRFRVYVNEPYRDEWRVYTREL